MNEHENARTVFCIFYSKYDCVNTEIILYLKFAYLKISKSFLTKQLLNQNSPEKKNKLEFNLIFDQY